MKTSVTKRFITAAIAVILLSAPFAHAQSIEGDWHGVADLQSIKLRISLHVTSTDGGYASTWDSPDQGAFGIPSTTTEFSYPEFEFTHAGAGLKYKGQVDPSYTLIEGFLEQGGRKFSILFGRDPIAPPPGSVAALRRSYDKQETYITMRDGVRLFTSIYTPKDTLVTHPILIMRTPYNSEPSGPDNFNYFVQLYSRYIDEGYIMVFQDVRGKYMSEGVFEDIRPYIPEKKSRLDTDETTDTWDTVDWLIKNVPNNNGRAGIFGTSYPGFYATMGIIDAHPAIRAVSPQAPVTDWFLGDDFHHNGAFFMLDCFDFYYSFGQPRKGPSRVESPSFKWPVEDNYEFFMSVGAIRNLAPLYLGDSIKFWNDAFAHPNYDWFWQERNPSEHLTDVTPAVLTVGGWFDAEDLYGALQTYEAIENQNISSTANYLVMGPWSHGQWATGKATGLGNIHWGTDANEDFQELEERFFNYHLKEEGSPEFAEATIFVTGSNEWRSFDAWPPKNATGKKLWFHPGEKASFTPPTSRKSFDEYVSDPMNPVPYTEDVHKKRTQEYMTDDQRFASRRPDVMVYQTDILDEDVTITGPVVADLFVSTTGTDADFVVKLIDVFPPDMKAGEEEDVSVPLGGYQMLVRGEILRGKYRNSFEKPEPFVPGRVTEVKYELPDVAHTFRKGHRIMIQVQSSWFPLVDRNPQKFVNIYECTESDFQKATHRIYHDAKRSSHIIVNVLQQP
ncbi:MAG: CocE/NonD family hydrolase [Bacteroidales bacterium]|nr:CocE/NonD family hydrolase [Bacteroidales bacterium]